MKHREFFYGKDKLTVQLALELAEGSRKGVIAVDTGQLIARSQEYVQQMVDEGKTVYGVTTGFGILANTRISAEDAATLQYKILQSHSVGVGDPIPSFIAKLMLITKLHAL